MSSHDGSSRSGNYRIQLRGCYGFATIAAVMLGLGSRHFAASLPAWLADHAGDALWAAMIYFGCRLLWPGQPSLYSALTALLFCYAIECSQLYHADWIDGIRHTTLGGLVLGQGFLAVDLLRYAAGIGLALLLDWLFRRRRGV